MDLHGPEISRICSSSVILRFWCEGMRFHLPLVFRELLLRFHARFLLGPRRAAPTCVMDIDYHPSPRRLSLTGGSFSRIPFAPRTTVFIQSKRRTRSRSVGTRSAVRRSRGKSCLIHTGWGSSRLHVDVTAHFSRTRADFAHLTPLENFAMISWFRAFAPKVA